MRWKIMTRAAGVAVASVLLGAGTGHRADRAECGGDE